MRPRKLPPVEVPAGSKFCFKCTNILPMGAFATDAKQFDGKRIDCRRCDSAAAYARQLRKRAREQLRGPCPAALMSEVRFPPVYRDRDMRAVRAMQQAVSSAH